MADGVRTTRRRAVSVSNSETETKQVERPAGSPDCYGKYPKKPSKKCNWCNFHRGC